MPNSIDYPTVTIYTKAAWADGWTERPTLRLRHAAKCVAPQMPSAVVDQWFGETNETDRSTFATETALDLRGHYLRVLIGSDEWIGIIVSHADSRFPGDGATATGSRVIEARGLEYLLTQQVVHFVAANRDGLQILTRPIRFNETHFRGGETSPGNKYTEGLFFAETGDAWTIKTIIEYLLDHVNDSPISATPGGQIADLDQVSPIYDAWGKSVYQCLNELIDRRRGYTWTIRFNAGTPYVHVSSLFGNDVTVGVLTFHANAEKGAVAASADTLKRLFPETSNDALYDTVRVIGAPIRCVCSVGQNVTDRDEGSLPDLPDGWSAGEEQAVKDGGGGEPGYADLTLADKIALNDDVRAEDRYKHVFARYALDATAMGALLDSVGLALDTDGEFLINGALTVPFSMEWLRWGRPFLRTVLLKERVDYSVVGWPANAADSLPPGGPILAVYDATDSRWRLAADLQVPGVPDARVRMEDRGAALRIQFTPPYLLATTTAWADAEPGGFGPAFGDTRTFVATVALELDESLQVAREIAANEHADFDRELVIHVPDARLDYAHRHTCVGVADDGTLQWLYLAGGMDGVVMDGGTAVAITLRDDSDRLKAIALLAAEWYGNARATSKFEATGMSDLALPGKYVTNLTADGQTFAVNSIVTKQTWDARSCVTRLETNWFDVDWVRVAGPNVTGRADHRAMARELDAVIANLAAEVRETSE